MVRPLQDDCTRARGNSRFPRRKGEDRQTQRRRKSSHRRKVRHPVDSHADDLQGRSDGFAPDRSSAEAEAGAVDHHGGVTPPHRDQPEIFLAAAGRNAGRLRCRFGLPTSGPSGYWSIMAHALRPPFPPMEALSVDDIPTGEEWQYEPKWDGFRCLVFRDGNKIELQSKSGQSLTRYFPELVEAVRGIKAATFVLDGEIVVPVDRAFSFDALLQRIHPAQSRVQKLATETPALLIVFDLLAGADGKPLIERPLRERRLELEAFAHKWLRDAARIQCHPQPRSSPRPRAGSSAWVLRSMASWPSGVISNIARVTAPGCRKSRTIAAPTASSAAS